MFFALLGYAIGSLPLGWLFVRRRTGADLRGVGSGNVGATNAMRAGGWRTGVAVACMDIAKGAVPVWLSLALGAGPAACASAGVGAVVGHVAPVWLQFRGGKGVATAFGAFLVLAPLQAGLAALVALLVAAATRIVSLASLCGAVVLCLATWLGRSPRPIAIAATSVTVLVVARHAGNIGRLMRGVEPRVGARSG